MDAIKWGRFGIYKCTDADLEEAPDLEFPFVPGSRFRAVNTGIDEPACQINYEDFYKGKDIVWTLAHDEVQYVVSGRAEIQYHLPPLMIDSGVVIAEPGCVYYLPRGCRVVWRVPSGGGPRHLWVNHPQPRDPLEGGRRGRAAS